MIEPAECPDPALCEQCGIPSCRGECDTEDFDDGSPWPTWKVDGWGRGDAQ